MNRADLEQERRFLLDSILDLEIQYDAGEITRADYESLRDDYTARAAEVLRALEEPDRPAPAPPRPTQPTQPTQPQRRHPTSRRTVAVLLIAGLGLLAVLSVSVLTGSSGPKSTSTPGGGSITQRLSLAHQLESQGQALEALKLYDSVLKDDPANVEALTYRGWLLKLAGLIDESQLSLDKALAADPSYPDAHFFRGMLLFQDRNDPTSAIPEFEAFLASNPPADTVDAVRGVLEQARQAAGGPPATGPGVTATSPSTIARPTG